MSIKKYQANNAVVQIKDCTTRPGENRLYNIISVPIMSTIVGTSVVLTGPIGFVSLGLYFPLRNMFKKMTNYVYNEVRGYDPFFELMEKYEFINKSKTSFMESKQKITALKNNLEKTLLTLKTDINNEEKYNEISEKYNSRIKVIGLFEKKITNIESDIDKKLVDYKFNIELLKRDYEFTQLSKNLASNANNILNNEIDFDDEISKVNKVLINDINEITSMLSIISTNNYEDLIETPMNAGLIDGIL
jgi:hypothetical protein